MAVDYNIAKLLLWAKNLGVSFEQTLTLGHLGFFCSPRQLRKAVQSFGIPGSREAIDRCANRPTMGALYADEFLRYLGAKGIVSVDYSDFEGATLLHDLNKPFPENHRERYTLVIDGGTLEHVFDYPSALRHCLELISVGGHFITATPAHGGMGHGFYQFSPELFFRVFSRQNGFVLRKMVLFNASKADAPFVQVNDPAVTGLRTELSSKHPMMLAVLAKRVESAPIFAQPPMQSDYVAVWERHQKETKQSHRELLYEIRERLNPYWPEWLRRWKQNYLYCRRAGPPSLKNRVHFRKLSRKEIFNERDEG